MTEVHIPKGQAVTPSSLPSIAWYEFILNEKLLKDHLSQDNPDPSPCQLLVQFLQQTEIEMAALVQAASEKKPQLPPGVVPIPVNKTDEETKPVEPTKKVMALRLLAVKVGCYLRWNLSTMEKGVPIPILQALLIQLLQFSVPQVIDNIHNPDLEVSSLDELGFFVVHLFHRWCIRSVVRDSFPTKPVKQAYIPAPGQVDPNLVMSQATDTIIRKFKEELPASIIFLENCLQALETEQSKVRMPSAECFVMPGEENESQFLWNNTVELSAQEITSQICFDLGALYFFKGDYRKAFEKFRVCKQLLSQFQEPLYCYIDENRLRGYLTSCSSLLGVTPEAKTPSLFERAELARKKDFQGIVDVLKEDNIKQELDISYRNNLQDEVLRRRMSDLHVKIYLCNVVRTVAEGRPVVSPILDTVKHGDFQVINLLIELLSGAMKDSSVTQKTNVKSFVLHLIELLPTRSDFTQAVMTSDLMTYISPADMESVAVAEPDINNTLLLKIGLEDTIAMTSFLDPAAETISNASDVEDNLLTVYDPHRVRDILLELYDNRKLNPVQIIGLNDKWKVSKEMKHLLDTVNSERLQEFDKVYMYVLTAKAQHCLDLKIYGRARQLFQIVESKLAEVSFLASRHPAWQVLLTDLSQLTYKHIINGEPSIPGLAFQCKQCLSSVRFGQEIIPNVEVIKNCCAFMCNVAEWQFLSELANSSDGLIELSRILACLVKDLLQKKNVRKQARDLWDAVINIYQQGNIRRPSNLHPSALRRDQQFGLLAKSLFCNFLQNIWEPTVLSILISLFVKLFAVLKDDISSEIATEYPQLWPTALGVTMGNVGLVEDSLKMLLAHALEVHPCQPSWLRTQADMYFVEGQHSTALKFYLQAGVVATDFFTCPVLRSIFDDVVYRRMIKCCSYLQCHTQVAVLCQYLEEPDYSTAFKALQERNVYDAMDAYYSCIWDVSLLEFLVNIHTKKGETDKRQSAVRALSQMDLNSNNPDQIQKRAVHIRKTKFLRAMAKQYLG